MFSSDSTCVKPTQLTSNSGSNEIVLDAPACYGYEDKLPTNIDFDVDGSSQSLHASCSQPLNLKDVIYTNSKGSLIVVDFESMSGRTEKDCPGISTTTTSSGMETAQG